MNYSKEEIEKYQKQIGLFSIGIVIIDLLTLIFGVIALILILGHITGLFTSNIKFWLIVAGIVIVLRIFNRRVAIQVKNTNDNIKEMIKE
ncbi:hypothetical protein KYI11_10855 [Macrococcoides bohemicum]|uniref:Uncharacterized protein n=1 Tax=Macrococcoides bohemicum TaxID=1903056 RepID=A0AAJ4PAB8_9STAP|nr:hypothetical protein [Macrococcus bohemicus]QYA42082.1 hypothetical protein KYI11_10855 [Macrococcus bohemicus]